MPVEPVQQCHDHGAAFDVDVQRAGLDLQPFGKDQRLGLLETLRYFDQKQAGSHSRCRKSRSRSLMRGGSFRVLFLSHATRKSVWISQFEDRPGPGAQRR